MYPLDVVAHIVYSAEDSIAAIPFAHNAGVVLCFVPSEIFLAGKSAACGLWTSLMAAEEGFCVTLVMLSQVASSREHCSRCAARVSTRPSAVLVEVPVLSQIRCVWG